MAQPYVGEIRMFAGNFAPAGWMFCEGQLLPISEYETLFTLIGTTYGGDGQSTFGLPDLRGRLPVHAGQNYVFGQLGGSESNTLTTSQVPNHTHQLLASSQNALSSNATGAVLGQTTSFDVYRVAAANTTLAPSTLTTAGGSQPHMNFQPYLCVDFIISLFGIFPSQG
jgi:microcystin-dependent protein